MGRGSMTAAQAHVPLPLRAMRPDPGIVVVDPLAPKRDALIDVPGAEIEFSVDPLLSVAGAIGLDVNGSPYLVGGSETWPRSRWQSEDLAACPTCVRDRMPSPCWHIRAGAYLALRGVRWPDRVRAECTGEGRAMVTHVVTERVGIRRRPISVAQAVRLSATRVHVISSFRQWPVHGSRARLYELSARLDGGGCGACRIPACPHLTLAERLGSEDIASALARDLASGRVRLRRSLEAVGARGAALPDLEWRLAGAGVGSLLAAGSYSLHATARRPFGGTVHMATFVLTRTRSGSGADLHCSECGGPCIHGEVVERIAHRLERRSLREELLDLLRG